MRPLAILVVLCLAGILFLMVLQAGRISPAATAVRELPPEQRIDESVAAVNSWFRQYWADEGVEPAALADDLTVYRRLSLALHGTVPSLEEIRVFAADSSHDRIERWLLKLLQDERFADYFSERLTRMLTGTEGGAFLVYRRDRLQDWLAEQLRQDRPWPDVASELIAAKGLWTDQPASNFISAAFIDGEGVDENKLAGKTVRAFLGQRIDCAECHDHPFDDWKQRDFEGLAAYFGQARITPGGAVDRQQEDGKPIQYEVIDPGSETGRVVRPRVPFHEDWLGSAGSARDQLAAWVVHPQNRRFERAIANRVWGLMFGRPWHDPVDDLPHPDDDLQSPDLLDTLGSEFRNHRGSLKFLIRLIAESDAFRLSSAAAEVEEDQFNAMLRHWAVFPVVRLRPEQIIGSMFQAGHVRTINQNSHLFTRFARFQNENDFLKQYGDLGEDELLQQTGTIPQALLRMNGKFTRELTKPEAFTAAGQIARFSPTDEQLVDNCFLACLTRLPSQEEREYFVGQLRGEAVPGPTAVSAEASPTATDPTPPTADPETPEFNPSRDQVVRDLYWVLFNAPEFSWNH